MMGALAVATVGAVSDVRNRKIPNQLTYSGLLAGLALRGIIAGWPALRAGLEGVFVTGAIFAFLFLLGGVGGGDVKLMASVAAWAGMPQALHVLLAAAIMGGVLAVGYLCCRRQVLWTLLNTVEIMRHHLTSGLRPHPVLNVREPGTMRVSYGLAIALGALYCAGHAFWWR